MSVNRLQRSLKARKTQAGLTSGFVSVRKTPKPYVPNLFIKSQLDWINDYSPFTVWSKSRRIGASFSESYRAVRDALLGESTRYSTFNYQATKKFISNCAKWCKAFNHLFRVSRNVEVIDERQISIFIIHFPNGATIEAVSSNPENLRDFEGTIVLDEFAFRDKSLQGEILKAANAVGIRGGRVRVISTHNGVNNEFNKICEEISRGDREGSLHHTPFLLAVGEGMYKSMLAVKGEIWTPEKEELWVKKVYNLYPGKFGEEELDAIPMQTKGNQIFDPSWIQYVDASDRDISSYGISVVYFDLANTDQEKATDKSFFTAYVQLVTFENLIIIYDFGAVQLEGTTNNQWRLETIRSLPFNPKVLLESEPGSDLFMSYAKAEVLEATGIEIEGYKPTKSKLLRAMPLIPFFRKRSDTEFCLVIHERLRDRKLVNPVTQESKTFLEWIVMFDGSKDRPIVNDLVDSLSGAFDHLYQETLSRF